MAWLWLGRGVVVVSVRCDLWLALVRHDDKRTFAVRTLPVGQCLRGCAQLL